MLVDFRVDGRDRGRLFGSAAVVGRDFGPFLIAVPVLQLFSKFTCCLGRFGSGSVMGRLHKVFRHELKQATGLKNSGLQQ